MVEPGQGEPTEVQEGWWSRGRVNLQGYRRDGGAEQVSALCLTLV